MPPSPIAARGRSSSLNSSPSPVKKNEKRASYQAGTPDETLFTVVPLEVMPPTGTTTFMQNQIAVQRSPSTTHAHVSALARRLSIRSNNSDKTPGATLIPSNLGALVSEDSALVHSRSDSGSSLASLEDGLLACTLKKTPSQRSAVSGHSVESIRHLGAFPPGTLRIHTVDVEASRPAQVVPHPCQQSGDVFVTRDISGGVMFGYDTQAIPIQNDGDFHGIKLIPPGAHLIWTGTAGEVHRDAFWIVTKKLGPEEYHKVHVRHWDKYSGTLKDESASVAEAHNQRSSLAEYFQLLEEYALNDPATSAVWQQLTSCIEGPLLTKITGQAWNKWNVSTDTQYTKEMDNKPVTWEAKKIMRYLFPNKTRMLETDVSGHDRANQAVDTTTYIRTLAKTMCTDQNPEELIGELQFCYVTGMLLSNTDCQENWAHIIKGLFQAYKMVLEEPIFGRKLIEAVHSMMLFDTEYSNSTSIFDQSSTLEYQVKALFTTFKKRLDQGLLEMGNFCTEEHRAVGKAFNEFESYLWKKGWEIRQQHIPPQPAKQSVKSSSKDDYDSDGSIESKSPPYLQSSVHHTTPRSIAPNLTSGERTPVTVTVDDDKHKNDLVA